MPHTIRFPRDDRDHRDDKEARMSELSPEIDTSRPHSARMYDYLLGGKDHFATDREAADRLLTAFPSVRVATRENRAFLGRAVRYLAAEAGVRQFLDIGAGLPSASNVHEIAQGAAPSSRVVYVDNDPLVLAHARALLASGPEGRTAYIHADLSRPEEILSHPVTREVLDLTQPVALILVAILHLIPDEDKPAEIVATLLDALPPGSFLVATHGTPEHDPSAAADATQVFRAAGLPFHLRDTGDFARLAFSGLELVPPGVVLVSEWRRDDAEPYPTSAEVGWYGGVARKTAARPT
jgi:SAM-dependent methyltransferase